MTAFAVPATLLVLFMIYALPGILKDFNETRRQYGREQTKQAEANAAAEAAKLERARIENPKYTGYPE